MTLSEFYRRIYRLRFITRYSNIPRIRDEDVAQHSFFVASIILKLNDEYVFNLGLALQAAISHDISESDLGDITHGVKMMHPLIAEGVKEAERKVVSEYPASVQEGVRIFESNTVEGWIANLADILQISQYVGTERSLGNTTMNYIHAEARKRADELGGLLDEYRRNT